MDNDRCAVTMDLHRHQTALDHAGRWADAVDARTAELLKDEYDPLTPDNMADALDDVDMIGIQALCTLLRSGNHDGAGLVLKALVGDYWERVARVEAVRQIDAEIGRW